VIAASAVVTFCRVPQTVAASVSPIVKRVSTFLPLPR
jgi:hypothetical protein